MLGRASFQWKHNNQRWGDKYWVLVYCSFLLSLLLLYCCCWKSSATFLQKKNFGTARVWYRDISLSADIGKCIYLYFVVGFSSLRSNFQFNFRTFFLHLFLFVKVGKISERMWREGRPLNCRTRRSRRILTRLHFERFGF